MNFRHPLVVAVLAAFATAVVLASGAGASLSPLELRAMKALAAARPVAAAAAPSDGPAGAASGPQHSVPPTTASGPVAGPAPVVSAPAPAPAPTGDTSDSEDPEPTTTAAPTAEPTIAPPEPSSIEHVYVIPVAGPGYQETFGTESPATYLTEELRPQGAVLSSFAPISGPELPNYLALASGQAPNASTREECAKYVDFPLSSAPAASGLMPGDGCIYPTTALSLGDQVTSSGASWRAYAEDMNSGEDAAATCRHPVVTEADPTFDATEGYVTRHNPFVYFHSLLDLGDCLASVVDLDTLKTDLKSPRTTPKLAYISPSLCNSGSVAECDGEESGLASADAFLKTWVPRILASPGFKSDGVLIIPFLSNTTGSTDATGALVIAPSHTRKGTLFASEADPYVLLRTIEDLLGLEPLGHAAKVKSLAKVLFPSAF